MMRLFAMMVVVAVFAACTAKATPTKEPSKENTQYMGVAPGTSSASDVQAKLGKPDRESEDVTRGSHTGLRLMMYDDPATSVFLDNDRVLLIVVVPDQGSSLPESRSTWEELHGESVEKLPSFRAREAQVHLRTGAGVAAHVLGDQILAIEIFSPMASEEYQARLYKKPPHPRR